MPEEASFEGDLGRSFFSFSDSDLLGLCSLDFDLLSLDLLRLGKGDLDFLLRSFTLFSVATGDFFLSLVLTLSSGGDLDLIFFFSGLPSQRW